ncbi:hypothetical protein DK847_05520 [Aestuariivirga litoralis]|uniref:Rap1a immunity protein domain-containing protein n=1 Tax=Aestuariivirga litoralis TaxID=2650924 RepID=A0A2W2BWR5_9HYPH|nr:Rap1a/Tai family immunity protein [Aestuariivirga litoralis]PZF77886.1 hypothetical protein DK847_05520 [Aestuariivirga litoralis]
MIRTSRLLSAALFALAGLAPLPASAGTVTGQQLLSLCTANMWGKGHATEAAECMGYVIGVSDTFNCIESDHGFTWDSGRGVSQPAMVASVVQWLQNHPEALQFEAHRVVGAALQAAFPCK